ncbi:MAG: lactate utilization protein [Proteobacteria bacterium]|nr:lactate utilization protein [Pseudomonadota bacterium]
MGETRAEFLARVRDALARGAQSLPGERPVSPPVMRFPPDPAASFAAELEAVGGRVHRLESAAEVGVRVAELVREEAAGRVARAGTPGLEDFGLDAALATTPARLEICRPGAPADVRSLADVDLAITAAEAGLADTGTLVLRPGPAHPRALSVLAPVHVAILREEDLHPHLAAFAASEARRPRHPCILVTGPSRTADIEMILTRGVHGPRTLHVVLVGSG